MEPQFRPATAGDTDRLVGLMREYYAFDRIDFDEPWAREALGRLLADPALGRAWLIEWEGQVAGYLFLTFGYSLEYKRDAFLDELYVCAPLRGRGIGRKAVEHVVAACPALGIAALHLVVVPGNERARRLYESLGFEDEQRRMLTRRLERPPRRPDPAAAARD